MCPLTCRLNCMDGMLEESRTQGTKITRNSSDSHSKQDTSVSAEIIRKLCGWHDRRKRDHVYCIGKQTEGVTTRICVGDMVEGHVSRATYKKQVGGDVSTCNV